VNLNAGIVNATGSAYFMMGSNIAAGSSAAGFSLRHGMGITVEGGYDGGWVYARLGGGLQYDFYLVKREGMTCDGQPLGINGWYGSAKVNAWLYASAGVRFWGLDFNVLSANVLANMEVRGPKPLYFYGRVKGHYSVGYGWLSTSGDFDVEVKKGSYCSF
jgi:hypothetical protein